MVRVNRIWPTVVTQAKLTDCKLQPETATKEGHCQSTQVERPGMREYHLVLKKIGSLSKGCACVCGVILVMESAERELLVRELILHGS